MIFLVGAPGRCGGAFTESGDTALLLREAGLDISCLSLTTCSCGKPVQALEEPWVARFQEADIPVVQADPRSLEAIPGLRGAIVLSFCHPHLLHNWEAFLDLGCRVVWSPCMSYTTVDETHAFRKGPPALVHLQSEFQASRVLSDYRDMGVSRHVVIPGAFRPLPFVPRDRDGFVVGRLARPCRTKWSPNLWPVMEQSRLRVPDLRALCQAWSLELDQHVGTPPAYATCLPKNHLDTKEFLARCHVMVAPNWCVDENWPRVGLEAMSAGVPIIADATGGWPAMLGGCGILAATPKEYVDALVLLGTNEAHRLWLVAKGRDRAMELADAKAITQAWMDAIGSL